MLPDVIIVFINHKYIYTFFYTKLIHFDDFEIYYISIVMLFIISKIYLIVDVDT